MTEALQKRINRRKRIIDSLRPARQNCGMAQLTVPRSLVATCCEKPHSLLMYLIMKAQSRHVILSRPHAGFYKEGHVLQIDYDQLYADLGLNAIMGDAVIEDLFRRKLLCEVNIKGQRLPVILDD